MGARPPVSASGRRGRSAMKAPPEFRFIANHNGRASARRSYTARKRMPRRIGDGIKLSLVGGDGLEGYPLPNSLPAPKVTAPAAMPIAILSSPLRHHERDVITVLAAPTTNSTIMVAIAEMTIPVDGRANR